MEALKSQLLQGPNHKKRNESQELPNKTQTQVTRNVKDGLVQEPANTLESIPSNNGNVKDQAFMQKRRNLRSYLSQNARQNAESNSGSMEKDSQIVA